MIMTGKNKITFLLFSNLLVKCCLLLLMPLNLIEMVSPDTMLVIFFVLHLFFPNYLYYNPPKRVGLVQNEICHHPIKN